MGPESAQQGVQVSPERQLPLQRQHLQPYAHMLCDWAFAAASSEERPALHCLGFQSAAGAALHTLLHR